MLKKSVHTKISRFNYFRKIQFIVLLVLLAPHTNAQSKKFNNGWEFIGREFANQTKIDSLRRLGVNWNDQFTTEKTTWLMLP